MSNYNEVREDWETLWNICPADDMTGAYVDSGDLDRMLKTPTKKMAIQCMKCQIDFWLNQGIEDTNQTLEELMEMYPQVIPVAEKYGYA